MDSGAKLPWTLPAASGDILGWSNCALLIYHLHLADGDIEAQGCPGSCPRSHSQKVSRQDLNLCFGLTPGPDALNRCNLVLCHLLSL